MTTQTLHDNLSNLDTDNDCYGIFVNRYNLDDYAIKPFAVGRDTLADGKIWVGRLNELSCGSVDDSDDIDAVEVREIQLAQTDVMYEKIQDYLKEDGEYDSQYSSHWENEDNLRGSWY